MIVDVISVLWAQLHNVVGLVADLATATVAVPLVTVMLVIYAVGLVQCDATFTVESSRFRPPPSGDGGLVTGTGTERKWLTLRCNVRASKYAMVDS